MAGPSPTPTSATGRFIRRSGRQPREYARGPPLCPAGHLPLKGGDQQLRRWHLSFGVGGWRRSA
ncbi:MAG: hypothetical protein EOS32_11525 [Mesorhizobium sp.]|nr:MAG: hypothetical protein EOS32_11525 [Mesorhizobium sp.]